MRPNRTIPTLLALAAALALGGYAELRGAGLVGWLDYAQQVLFGRYSYKLAALVVFTVALMLGLAVSTLLSRLILQPDDYRRARARAPGHLRR